MRFLTTVLVGVAGALPLTAADPPGATGQVHNPIDVARPSETISLSASDLRRLLQVDDIRRIHVLDPRSGQDLVTQAVDNNGDGTYDELLFQTNMDPDETRTFQLSVGQRRILKPQDFKAYGRFVREREDDFAWENDRIAHRMYGKALETWPQEPLTSSAIDVWVKSVPRLVINDWYMVDDYHRDHGEGGDFYPAGDSRGCGGNGIWAGEKLYPSRNFVNSQVLANGPIRLIFELTYAAWDAAGVRVKEVKRVTLDAGQNFNRFESHYTMENGADLQEAIGIRKGSDAAISSSRESGSLRSWETLPDGHGQLGCAMISDPSHLVRFAEDAKNFLAISKIPADGIVTYYAGFGWSKDGFATIEGWDRYVSDYERRLRAPVDVKLSRR